MNQNDDEGKAYNPEGEFRMDPLPPVGPPQPEPGTNYDISNQQQEFIENQDVQMDRQPSVIQRRATFANIRSGRESMRQQNQQQQQNRQPLSAAQKKKVSKDAFQRVVFDFVFGAILLALTIWQIAKYDEEDRSVCREPLETYIIVYVAFKFVGVLKNFIIGVAYCTEKERTSSFKGTIDFCFCCFIVNFQICWFIYGNTFIYSDHAISFCKEWEATHILWCLALICVIFPYFMIFLFLIICIVVCALGMVRGVQAANQAQNPMVDRIPYLNAVQNLRRRNYNDIDDKYMDSCAICLQDFSAEDEIAELNCQKAHYFHSQCVEDWLKRKLECPLCKAPVSGKKQ